MRRRIKILEVDKRLNYAVNRIYFDSQFTYCDHSTIALDDRDNIYKCIKQGCWKQFWFRNEKQFKRFIPNIIKDFDFQKSEVLFQKRLLELENKSKTDLLLKNVKEQG